MPASNPRTYRGGEISRRGHLRVLGAREVIQIKWPDYRTNEMEDRFYARCQDCGWECHNTPHRDKEVAERCMGRHVVSKHWTGQRSG